jgi:hypothetical protein
MKINKYRKLTLTEWMTKHQVSTYHTNINLAIAQAINSQDREELALTN